MAMPEKTFVRCDDCGGWLALDERNNWGTYHGPIGAPFDNPSHAGKIARAAGWYVDARREICATCRTWDHNHNGMIDDADELAAFAELADHNRAQSAQPKGNK